MARIPQGWREYPKDGANTPRMARMPQGRREYPKGDADGLGTTRTDQGRHVQTRDGTNSLGTTRTPQGRREHPNDDANGPWTTREPRTGCEQTRNEVNGPRATRTNQGRREYPKGRREQPRDDANIPMTTRTAPGRHENPEEDPNRQETTRTPQGQREYPKAHANGPGTTRCDNTRGMTTPGDRTTTTQEGGLAMRGGHEDAREYNNARGHNNARGPERRHRAEPPALWPFFFQIRAEFGSAPLFYINMYIQFVLRISDQTKRGNGPSFKNESIYYNSCWFLYPWLVGFSPLYIWCKLGQLLVLPVLIHQTSISKWTDRLQLHNVMSNRCQQGFAETNVDIYDLDVGSYLVDLCAKAQWASPEMIF